MDDPIGAFTAEARRHCSLIEDSSAPNSRVFAQACLTQVLRLYEAALLLPEVTVESVDLLEGIKHAEWNAVRENVARRLARDYYWEVFEPLEREKPDPLLGSLSDDLADIWRDLLPGLRAIDNVRTTSITDVLWHWRDSFETHWGHHAAGAIAARHALCFGEFADSSRSAPKPSSNI